MIHDSYLMIHILHLREYNRNHFIEKIRRRMDSQYTTLIILYLPIIVISKHLIY
jgi:hypothetical protein